MTQHATDDTDSDRRTERRPRRPDDGERPETGQFRPTLGDCSHTNPHTDESFGDAMVYQRGPLVVADGGAAGAADPESEQAATDTDEDAERTDETLEDVEHTPPRDAENANRVHERGGEKVDTTGHEEGV